MRRCSRYAVIAALAALLSAAATGPSRADSTGVGVHLGSGGIGVSVGRYIRTDWGHIHLSTGRTIPYGTRNHYVRRHRYQYSDPLPPRIAYRRPCHPVEKVDLDQYGRWTRFGAFMCYDSYGRAFIQPGSIHVIQYLR